jgi:hypothetical protein
MAKKVAKHQNTRTEASGTGSHNPRLESGRTELIGTTRYGTPSVRSKVQYYQ